MNRNGHLAVAALTASVVSWEMQQPIWQRALSPILALATAMAPDVDNTRWWQEIRQHIPIKAVRKALNHRGFTHSWLIPTLLWFSQDTPAWTFVALTDGYASHIIADALFGKTGVPIVLWFLHFGLRLPMGKQLENVVTVAATAYAAFTVVVGWYLPVHYGLIVVGTLMSSILGWFVLIMLLGAFLFLTRARRREKRSS